MTKVILNVSIDSEVFRKLEKYVKKNKVSRSKVVNEAIKEYLKSRSH
jgi:metal-responsive CopG/Arc/MetJ family transcriptional regulator